MRFRRSARWAAGLSLAVGLLSVLPVIPAGPVGPGAALAEDFTMAGVKVNVIEKKLDNGLTLIMVENHQSPTVGLITQFAAGSVDEWDGISGTAHILEHTLFKGTAELGTTDWAKEKVLLDRIEETAQTLRLERNKEHRADPALIKSLEARIDSLQGEAKKYIVANELDRIYTENGGQSINAGTSWDGTSYQVALPSNRLELWMKLESDRLRAPVLREFYTELNNIMEERRLRIYDDPAGPIGKLAEVLYRQAYLAHRYGVPIVGWPSDILHVTRTEVEAFFRKFYAPNRMTLAIVGDIDPARTFELVKTYFGTIPRQPDPLMPRTVEPPQEGERRADVEYEAEPRVMMAWHVTDGLHPDYPAILLLDDILTGGRSSRLNKEVVETQKVAASISGYTGVPGERYPTLYVLEATPLQPHTTAEVEKAIYEQIDRLKNEPVSDEELAASKLHYRKSFVDGLVDNLGLATILASNQATLGDWREGFRRADAVSKVTAADIQRVARTYLKTSNRSVATLVKPAKEELASAAPADPAAQKAAMDLVAGAVKALGGPAYQSIKDLRTESKVTIHAGPQNIEGASKEVTTADGRTRSELSIMGQTQVQVFDGQGGWLGSAGAAQDAPPEVVDEMKSTLQRQLFLWTFNPASFQGTLTPMPDADFNGVSCKVVQVAFTGGKPFVLYLDAKSGLPIGQSFDSKNPMTGKPGRAEVVFSGYAASKGAQFPAQQTLKFGGQAILDETITARTLNAGVQPDEFKKP